MKELLKKLRWKWHRDLTEGSLQELSAKLDKLDELHTELGILTTAVLEKPIKAKEVSFSMSPDVQREWDRLVDMMRGIGTIPERALRNAKICPNRVDILYSMPKNAVCAEVGVAYGDFSKFILEIMHPSRFYAIDYFGGEGGGCDIWGRTDLADSGLTHFQWYKRKFAQEIQVGRMEVLQGFSWEVLETFPDRYFDYIYLDACHSYDSVSKDVEVIRRKIKQDGIIAFNDYTLYNFWTPCTDVGAYYGVVPAANQLINETNSEVLFMGLEPVLSNDLVIRYQE